MKTLSFLRKAWIGAIALVGFLASSSAAEAAQSSSINWYQDYDQAVKVAKKEHKPLFVFFTGSDWCGWCKRLNKEVLDTPEFVKGMKDQFVFVLVDFPRGHKLDTKVMEQNQKLKAQYDVKGFPTIVLLSPDQKKIGVVGYQAGGPENYMKMLRQMIGVDQKAKAQLDKSGAKESQILPKCHYAMPTDRIDESQQIFDRGLHLSGALLG